MIRIAFSDPAALAERCEIASLALALCTADTGYDHGAVVPTGDWRTPTPGELSEFEIEARTPPSTVIELVSVPINRVKVRAELPARAGDFDPFDGRHPAEILGYADQAGGQLTTTIDPSRDVRIGVHVDNFDRLPYTHRTGARRRLAVNFGPAARYLLIGTRDMLEVCRAVYPADFERRHPHTDDLRTYVGLGLPIRCVRLRLEPGEGYIAPTELVPHDGSTWQTGESRVAFWLGRWPNRALPSLI